MVTVLAGIYILTVIVSNCETEVIENLLTLTSIIPASLAFGITFIGMIFFSRPLKRPLSYIYENRSYNTTGLCKYHGVGTAYLFLNGPKLCGTFLFRKFTCIKTVSFPAIMSLAWGLSLSPFFSPEAHWTAEGDNNVISWTVTKRK